LLQWRPTDDQKRGWQKYMRITFPVAALAVVTTAATCSFGLLAVASAQAASVSVRDGVYSEAQAKRGEALYAAQCSLCHGEDLMGTDWAPGFAGAEFYAGWDGQTLGDLEERIRTTMPLDNPESLEPPQVADIMAFILNRSDYPPGTGELPSELAALDAIRIEPRPGKGP
jgi:mono/diheme cytochrome c family protein